MYLHRPLNALDRVHLKMSQKMKPLRQAANWANAESLAVRDAVYRVVSGAVNRAVDVAVRWAVSGAVRMAVDRAVRDPAHEAVYRAVREGVEE